MNIKYPDYKNCIANLACSIMRYYGVTPANATFSAADEMLCKKYKNVVVILLDGMGVKNMEQHLLADGFFRRNMKCSYSSTFPPTTVAATTAIDSGLFPNQSAWLGWTGYFREIDKNVVYFLNTDNDTGEEITDFNVARTLVPYESIRDKIKEKGIDSYFIAPFIEPFPKNYDDFCWEIKTLCDMEASKYIYAYWDDPDLSMHEHGVDGEIIHYLLNNIEMATKRLAEDLADTLLIITADHGHINVHNEIIAEYPDISECLFRMPSMETRALNLFIKKGMEKQFEIAFHKHFKNKFLLFSKSEVLEKQLFGFAPNHERLDDMLGDYIAVAISDVAIENTVAKHKGSHAGLTEDEMTIPFIAVDLKN